jgi:Na+/proline symporter
MEIIFSSTIFLTGMFGILYYLSRQWQTSFTSFLFADRSLQIGSAGLAISAHWFWAIAIFVGPAVAYNWGIIGLLWFAIPNALSLIVVGYLTSRVRENYPEGFSLTAYMKENFSKRIGGLFQLEFILISLAALILAFTAVGKLWAFTQLATIIEPVYASLAIGLVTLGFTLRGGIRTSIFTGAFQSILWLVFLGLTGVAIYNTDIVVLSLGKNELTTFFNEKFITTFAVAWFVTIIVGATSHGMMWQKAFSMPKENIMPSFTLGAVVFGVISFSLASLGMIAFANGYTVSAPDTAQMVIISTLLGVGGLVAFATILLGQTSTVIDSSLNYIASLVSAEWLKSEKVVTSRVIMTIFLLLAWIVSWAKLEIWTVLMLMGAVRISMFVPLALYILKFNLKEAAVFYSSIIAIVGTFYLAWIAKMDKLPIYDMYSVLYGLAVPIASFILFTSFKRRES